MKHIFLFILFITCGIQVFAQTDIHINDNSKIGFISTGSSANINVTQIFGKSPEYAEIKKAIVTLENKISTKAEKCKKYNEQTAKEDCRAEIVAMNAELDSIHKIESRFKEDVLRLAESFSKLPLNSDRIITAKRLFDEGKIREADRALNSQAMKKEGDALLAQKAREATALARTDSLLRIKSNEFALKARLKLTDYKSTAAIDSSFYFMEESMRYAIQYNNINDYTSQLREMNFTSKAVYFSEKAARSPFCKYGGDKSALLYTTANNLYNLVNYDAAKKICTEIITISNSDIEWEPYPNAKYHDYQYNRSLIRRWTYSLLGDIYHKQGLKDMAQVYYLKVIDENFASEFDLYKVASFFKSEGNIAKAEEIYKKGFNLGVSSAKQGMETAPHTALILYIYEPLIEFYLSQNKKSKADKLSEQLITFCQEHQKKYPSESKCLLGEVYFSLQNCYTDFLDSKISYLKLCSEQFEICQKSGFEKRLSEMYISLAEANARKNDLEKALVFEKKAFEELDKWAKSDMDQNALEYSEKLYFLSLSAFIYNKDIATFNTRMDKCVKILEQFSSLDSIKFERALIERYFMYASLIVNIESERSKGIKCLYNVMPLLSKYEYIEPKYEMMRGVSLSMIGAYESDENEATGRVKLIESQKILRKFPDDPRAVKMLNLLDEALKN